MTDTRRTKKEGDRMKVQIDDTIYEGTALEIVDRLRRENDDRNEYPDTESYIRQLRTNFMNSFKQDCVLPNTGLEDRARVLLFRLADVRSLEVLPDG